MRAKISEKRNSQRDIIKNTITVTIVITITIINIIEMNNSVTLVCVIIMALIEIIHPLVRK